MTGLIELVFLGKLKPRPYWRHGRKSLFNYISFSIGNFTFAPSSCYNLTRKDLIFRHGDFYSGIHKKSGVYKRYLHFFTIYKYN